MTESERQAMIEHGRKQRAEQGAPDRAGPLVTAAVEAVLRAAPQVEPQPVA